MAEIFISITDNICRHMCINSEIEKSLIGFGIISAILGTIMIYIWDTESDLSYMGMFGLLFKKGIKLCSKEK